MAMPPLMATLTDRIYRLPAPIASAWRVRNRVHAVLIEPGITSIQKSHFWFRRNVAWRTLGLLGVPRETLDSTGAMHEKYFGKFYDTARRVSWYL
ncbi:hypothetical protein JMUB6875_67290 [Nocardia sp. JMUB6875]|uniref:hypothetical protein n=1 Tax=Nocardia sp. JMUB6875 TaxID=3158170 RepID=UPI0032E6F699